MAVKKREIPKPPTATAATTTSARSKSARLAKATPAPTVLKATTVPVKNFNIKLGETPGAGKKILIHADSGMGKTTLASLAPGPVFIGLDNGGVGIKEYYHVGDDDNSIETYLDVRAALQADIYDKHETVNVDTVTMLEEWAEQHVLNTIRNDSGETMTSIVKYGWSNGFKHLYDMMKLILQDVDSLARKGKNIILIAQSTPHNIPNPGGEDFIRQGPRLVSRKNANIEALYCEWADHILYIGYQFLNVDKNKKATGSGGRAVFVHPEPHFRAKSRTLGLDKAVVSFEDPTDDSIWQFLFGKVD